MKYLIPALIVLAVPVARAWGPLGHRASALVAESSLNPPARAAVKQILGAEKLVDVSLWADYVRTVPSYQHTQAYHFENIADGDQLEGSLRRLPPALKTQGGSVAAILKSEAVLRDPRAPIEAKKIALKMLVHFVADLHQPLHTGRPEDRGGNDLRLRWGPRSTSLHSLWDSGLITTLHADIARDESEELGPAVELAKRITMHARSPLLRMRKTGDVQAWLAESLDLRRLAYDPRAVKAPEAYLREVKVPLEIQLYLAGRRTAEIFNRIFANQNWTPADVQTRAMIEGVLARLDEFVFIGPKPR